jgi:hypothetical protein
MSTDPREQSAIDVALSRLLVRTDDGRIAPLTFTDQSQVVVENLGLVTHAWERTTDTGQIAHTELVTDTGLLIRGDTIVHDGGVSTTVNLPTSIIRPETVAAAAESADRGGLLRRGGLSERRRRFLVDNAKLVAENVNRVFALDFTEYWTGWYSAEGIGLGIDGVYELDYADVSSPASAEEIHDSFKQRLVDRTRLTSDQADLLLTALPSTVEVKVDVFKDGKQIL